MFRRAQIMLAANALLMGIAAIVVSRVVDRPLLDPDGSFLGPTWVRLPLLLAMAIAADLIPRTLWFSRCRPKAMPHVFMERLRTHWTKQRFALVALGVISFYLVYVCYRNLKSSLPFLIHAKYDRELELIDTALFFGHHPGDVLQHALGGGITADFLSLVYIFFLSMVPVVVTIWLVWSGSLRFGYWFVSSQCLAWTFGTISYYMLPTLGPGIAFPYLYPHNEGTPAGALMDSIVNSRHNVMWAGVTDAVNSVAGFASLHVAITVLCGLLVQYTVKSRVLHWLMWADAAVTAVATVYFGWHNISDDVAGVLIAVSSFYLGGLIAGHKFSMKGDQAAVDDAEIAFSQVD